MSLSMEVEGDGRTPFLLLGAPRSGTNYVSALLKAHPEVALQVEPFSQHVRPFWDEDLISAGLAVGKLLCYCQNCFTCDLRSWLRGGKSRGFKETTLFEKLQAVKSWMPELRLLFLHRQEVDIIHSYFHYDLFRQWELGRRYYYNPHQEVRECAQRLVEGDFASQVELVAATLRLRQRYWEQGKGQFEYLELEYGALQADPAGTLRRAMQYLGLDLSPEQLKAIAVQRQGTKRSIYSTLGLPPLYDEALRQRIQEYWQHLRPYTREGSSWHGQYHQH